MIDIHTHILPGIDDGARVLSDSVDLVRELTTQGMDEIIATPHYVDETIYVSPRVNNQELLERLKEEIKKEGIKADLHLGNEIYINDRIHYLIQKKLISPLAEGEYILTELPMSGFYPNYEDILAELVGQGYRVILAHPERYLSFQNDFEIMRNLIADGILLQCNFGSFVGQYGKKAEATARQLAKEKMIFAFGSDIHHPHDKKIITKAKKKLKKYYKKDELENMGKGIIK